MQDNKNLNSKNIDSLKNVDSGAADNSAALDEIKKNTHSLANDTAENDTADKAAESAAEGKPDSVNTVENKTVENMPAEAKSADRAAENKPANSKPAALNSEYPSGAPKTSEPKKSKKGLIIAYSVCFGIELAFAALIAYSKGVFAGELSGSGLFGALSDSFFVPGVLFAGFGVLLKVAEGGFFDGISFGLKRAVLSFIPGARIKKEENYAQYKERKEKNRRHAKMASVLISGIVFIVIAAVFLIFY